MPEPVEAPDVAQPSSEVVEESIPEDVAAADTAMPETAEGEGGAPITAAEPLSEAEQLLGSGVRTPVGIPTAYQPTDVSAHALLRVEVDRFAGPLDLLLFLIRKHDIDVFDIPISFLVGQYTEMLESFDALEIDIAAEFLVMAAELTHIKSKMLLPPKEGVPVDPEDEDIGDPRSELVSRLLQYQKYREAAGDLGDLDRLGRDVFGRDPGAIARDESFDAGFRGATIFRLVDAMSDVLSRAKIEADHEVTSDHVSVSERVRHIMVVSRRLGSRMTFQEIFSEGQITRRTVVMTFLAVLEMARTGVLRIVQEDELVEPEPANDVQSVVGGGPSEEISAFGPELELVAPLEERDDEEVESALDENSGTSESADVERDPMALVAPEVEVKALVPPRPSGIFLELTGKSPPEDLLDGQPEG